MTKTAGVPEVELSISADWCRTIVQFLSANGPRESQAMYRRIDDMIAQALEDGDAQGLSSVARDLIEGVRLLPADLRTELDDLLRRRLGWGLNETFAARVKQVQRVLKRGAIHSDDEYSLLSGRAQEIADDGSKKAERDKIYALLARHDEPTTKG